MYYVTQNVTGEKKLDYWHALILYQITVQFKWLDRSRIWYKDGFLKLIFVFNPLLPVNFSGRHFLFDRWAVERFTNAKKKRASSCLRQQYGLAKYVTNFQVQLYRYRHCIQFAYQNDSNLKTIRPLKTSNISIFIFFYALPKGVNTKKMISGRQIPCLRVFTFTALYQLDEGISN